MGVDLDLDKYLLAGSAFGKKSLFIYKLDSAIPDFVVRIPENNSSEEKCLNEFNCLKYITDLDIPDIICPEAIAAFNDGSRKFYVHKIVRFKSLLSGISLILKTPPQRFFNIVTEVLVKLYLATKNDDNSLLGVPACFQHGDFWVGNIGIWKKCIVLMDLEFSDPSGIPLYDLLHFGLYFKVVNANIGKVSNVNDKSLSDKRIFAPDVTSVLDLLCSDDKLSRIMKKSIIQYLEQCSIDKNVGLDLIKNYFEKDRGINGLPPNWEQKIFN